jgi:glycosyltransferase involved in cell wall biosynthesis
MKPVVMLAYHFPPLGGIGVMRTLRLTRYLPEHGWRPVVVAVQGGGGNEPRDPALLEEVPGEVEVHRVGCLEPDNFADTWQVPGQKVVRNLFKTFDFLLFPDDRALWIGPAARLAEHLVRRHRAPVLWATGPPFSALAAALRVHRRTGVPWVADFRDDWTTDFRRHHHPGRQRRAVALEAEVLASAAAVVTVTPGVLDLLRGRRPPGTPPERFHLLPNGFDPAHFPPEPPSRRPERFTVLHAGGIYPQRDPSVFLEGLRRFLVGDPERRQKVRVRFLGRVDAAGRALLGAPDLQGVVEAPGFAPHGQVREEMRASDLLLLILEQVAVADTLYTGKIFEYMGARRPILALAPLQSPLADLVRQTGVGQVVAPDDAGGVARALEEAWQSRGRPCRPDAALLARYDARQQAGWLAGLLDQVALTPAGARP